MKPLIVIPTYNERRNIEKILPRIFLHAPTAEILLVDDASKDGTGNRALAIGRRFKRRLSVLRRDAKLGLGSAYVAGFSHALSRIPHADPIIQMDADGSHDPSALPVMIRLLSGCDAVIGSRYIRGTRVINWPWTRLLLSLSANSYARAVTGVPLSDLTGGFNAFRRSLIQRVGPETLRANGYAFQIELKALISRLPVKVLEMPIVFTGRVDGESKLSRLDVLEAMLAVWRLRGPIRSSFGSVV